MAAFPPHLTTRRRVIVSFVVVMAATLGLFLWGLHLWNGLYLLRTSGDSWFTAIGRFAQAATRKWGIYRSVGITALTVVLAGVLMWSLARWSLLPLRSMTSTLTRFGPANLGQRNRLIGPRDEMRGLGDAVDDMLDRFTAGFEGQRMFAANASHELRTPLALQRTLIEVSMGRALTPDQLTLVTRQLLHANERNEALIEGLLVLTESDRGLAGSEPVDLNRLVVEVMENHRDMADKACVSLRTTLDACAVRGERVLLDRLITNLVQNAIKYNEPGGFVEVTLTSARVLTVINTGETVPRELVGRLFEPFRRLTTDRVAHVDGAGLGLAIAQSIVRAHDATVVAQPRDGGGLRIEVEFPPAAG